jgi:hypothetical protein
MGREMRSGDGKGEGNTRRSEGDEKGRGRGGLLWRAVRAFAEPANQIAEGLELPRLYGCNLRHPDLLSRFGVSSLLPRPTFTLLLALVVLLLLWDQALWNVGFIGGMGFLGMRSLGSIGFIGSVGRCNLMPIQPQAFIGQPSCVMLVCCLCVLMQHHMHHRGDYRYWRALLWRVRSTCATNRILSLG